MRRYWRDKLDTLFSLVVRIETKKKYGRLCPFCGVRPIECCFHFITRSKWAIRWDFRNAIGSCCGCNKENEYNPGRFILWFLKNQGGQEAWERLVLDSHKVRKWSTEDLKDLHAEIQGRAEGMLKRVDI